MDENASLDSLLSGNITVPLPTYFSVGRHPLPSRVIERLANPDTELCHNLYFLGKRSTTKTSEGLRIVSLGGTLDPSITNGLSQDPFSPLHTEGDAKSLHGINNTDILVTNSWPSQIWSHSGIKMSNESPISSSEHCVAELCSVLKPRYHFSPSEDVFYEREPFFHLDDEGRPNNESITRFLSLAAYGNDAKQKWLYAFSIDPTAAPPTTLPTGATASPLSTSSRKRQRLPDQTQSFSRFAQTSDHQRHAKRSRHAYKAPPTPQECFFCLSNPNLASHMITSIGDDAYMTTAKGPLSTSKMYDGLDFPGHVLIMPLAHSATLASITPLETRVTTFKEMTRYRHALQRLLGAKANGSLGAVTWEISRAGGIHVHWQFLPVPADLVSRGLAEAAFKVEAENEHYPAFEADSIGNGIGITEDFFRVWIWQPGDSQEDSALVHVEETSTKTKAGQDRETELVLRLPSDFRFDLQFGRRVMAKLLGLETRVQWRDCEQEETEERKDADAFKAAFKEYDFSLDET